MRKSVLYTPFLFLMCGGFVATPSYADPVRVTGGQVTAQMNGGQFALIGDGFSVTGDAQSGFAGEIFQCEPCSGADRLPFNLSSFASGHLAAGPAEFDGLIDPSPNLFGVFRFSSPLMHSSSFLATGARSVTAPFSFIGEILDFPAFSDGTGTPIFFAELSGSGIATAHFTAGGDGSFFAHDITYQFADAVASPTPEPASLLLLGTGLAGLARRRIRAQR